MDQTLQRRAIYTGMRPYFDDADLVNAVRLWDREYFDKPKFGLTKFVSTCCSTPNFKGQRTQVLTSILKAMDLPAKKLLPDPLSEIKNGTLKLTNQLEQDNKTKVFILLLNEMLRHVDIEQQKDLRNYVGLHLEKLDINDRNKLQIGGWLSEKTSDLQASFDLPVIRSMINLVYVGLCEHVGPVRADQILAQSTKEIEYKESVLNSVELQEILSGIL